MTITGQQSLEAVLGRLSGKYEVFFEPLDVDGQNLQILSIANMASHIDGLLAQKAIKNPLLDLPLWAKVWPSSFVLGRFLRKYDPQGKFMLELGCGMGICSMIASGYGFRKILATDINKDALLFAKANILKNSLQGVITAEYLDVTSSEKNLDQKPDIICASELLYLDDLHRPLLRLVERELAPGGKAFFCTDMARDKRHFEKIAAKNFNVQAGCIGVKSDSGEKSDRRVYKILILERK